jgi:hypothetical protein
MPPVLGPRQSLVVLAGCQRQHMLAVDHHDETRLLALEEILDDHPCASRTHAVLDQHHVHRGVCFVLAGGDNHALAGGKAVRLDHDGRTAAAQIIMSRLRIGERRIRRGRNTLSRHERLREVLGAFELRGGLARTEDAQPGRAKGVHHALRQWCLRPDHRQRNRLLLRKGHQIGNRGNLDVVDAVLSRGAGIARRYIDTRDPRRLRQPPGQRVFPAAATDDEQIHVFGFLT